MKLNVNFILSFYSIASIKLQDKTKNFALVCFIFISIKRGWNLKKNSEANFNRSTINRIYLALNYFNNFSQELKMVSCLHVSLRYYTLLGYEIHCFLSVLVKSLLIYEFQSIYWTEWFATGNQSGSALTFSKVQKWIKLLLIWIQVYTH